jgi:hypothetical protein
MGSGTTAHFENREERGTHGKSFTVTIFVDCADFNGWNSMRGHARHDLLNSSQKTKAASPG